MDFYVASSFQNIHTVNIVQKRLRELGHQCTYDWTKNGRAMSLDNLREIGKKEKEAVMGADVVIVLLPAGKGSHIELGIAIGSGREIYLYSENEEVMNVETTSTFYHLEDVELVIGSIEDLLSTLSKHQ